MRLVGVLELQSGLILPKKEILNPPPPVVHFFIVISKVVIGFRNFGYEFLGVGGNVRR